MATILVVEDEPGIALGIEDSLRLEGHEVELIGDGAAAACRARQQQFDLILLDVMLPGKSGFEVCRELRRAGMRTPIVLLTARVLERDRILGLDLGANDYVTKPFSPRELMARVRRCCVIPRTPAMSGGAARKRFVPRSVSSGISSPGFNPQHRGWIMRVYAGRRSA